MAKVKRNYRSDAEYLQDHLKEYVGATLIAVETHGSLDGEELILSLKKDGKVVKLIPSMDPEGNGPGWLHIIKY